MMSDADRIKALETALQRSEQRATEWQRRAESLEQTARNAYRLAIGPRRIREPRE